MFERCATLEELKNEYRRLAFIHHPDKGGDDATMQIINDEYDRLLQTLSGTDDKTVNVGIQYKDIINSIIDIPNISIELCGTWIWVSGETRPAKDKLKDAKFMWASKKKMWYWKPTSWKRKSKQKSMEWIRATYGSEKVNQKSYRTLSL